ncbi:hypothetical protein GDO86_020060 [Hymenochirus boettgeri]|uniref:Ras-associating domain-containing protein n=1 Tax=Hymenochirus boettgeri TaxID=247094 RepID=A0A8T2IFE4_9PIPI|nr:hypothetical protein GDO86_020060 [Hymenochirus boettgeri]
MESEEWKVSVWLCQEEKLVSGLTKHTTCSDVIRVLLDDHNQRQEAEGSMLLGPPQSYCVVEKWRGFERILPNKTKLLRLWMAWGEEQENVRFVLVRNEASLPNVGLRSAEAKVVLSKESPCHQRVINKSNICPTQEKQRRVVRKAFRKLAKMNRKRPETSNKDSSSVEKMETLVHLVLSQDHTIRQQVQRIMDLDREIEKYEANIHFDRMKRHGVNYVQDTYLVGTVSDQGPSGGQTFQDKPLVESYVEKCDNVLLLQEQISKQQETMDLVTTQIQEELNKRWMDRRQEEISALEQEEPNLEDTKEGNQVGDDTELTLEEERVKTELSASLYIGLRLNTDLEAVKADLDLTQTMCMDKEKELQSLLQSLGELELPVREEVPETAGEDTGIGSSAESSPENSPQLWVEKELDLCTNCEVNDEDSDTGLSSMHSQDSDCGQVCESLV